MKAKRAWVKTVVSGLLCFLMTFCFGFSLAILLQDQEQISYLNATLFAEQNKPHSIVAFSYRRPNIISSQNELATAASLLDDIDGPRKYYNYACAWSESPEATIGDSQMRFCDLSYNPENPFFSTNFLELAYPADYALAFNQAASHLDFGGDYLKLAYGDSFALSPRLNGALVDPSSVVWEIEDPQIASVGTDGRVLGKAIGSTYLIATHQNVATMFLIDVSESMGNSSEVAFFANAVVPKSLAALWSEEAEKTVGMIKSFSLGGKRYLMKVCGFYEHDAANIHSKNRLYYDNFGDRIYYLRNAGFYLPTERYYVYVGTKTSVNMNVYADMKFFSKTMGVSFEIPGSLPINQVHFPDAAGRKINQICLTTRSNQLIALAVFLLLSSVGLILFLGRRAFVVKSKDKIPLMISLFAFGVLLPAGCFQVWNRFVIGGFTLPILTGAFVWFFIFFSVALSILLLRCFFAAETQKPHANLYWEVDI